MKLKKTSLLLALITTTLTPGFSDAVNMNSCKKQLTRFNSTLDSAIALEKKLTSGEKSQGTHTHGGHTPADWIPSKDMQKYKTMVDTLNTQYHELRECERAVKGFKITPNIPQEVQNLTSLELQWVRKK